MLVSLIFASAFAAELSALSWLEGDWRGGTDNVVYEESWQPALGGAMMGAFRLVKGESVRFYELMTLTGDELRIKHFGGDLLAWERKRQVERFTLAEVTGTRAVFRDSKGKKELRYELAGDTLRVVLVEPRERYEFTFQRADAQGERPSGGAAGEPAGGGAGAGG
jgi:hypothetical protein